LLRHIRNVTAAVCFQRLEEIFMKTHRNIIQVQRCCCSFEVNF